MLAVHPAFGGSWWSQLRPSDLRSYDGDPMTWDGFTDKLTEIGSGDWIFEIRLYIKDGLTGQVFNNQSQTPLKLLDDLVSSGEASFFLRNYITLSEWTGWHVIRLEVTGGTASLYLDNEFKASKTTGLSISFPHDSVTAADIGIDYAVLMKPGSDVPVWYAEYNDTHANYADRDFSISYQWAAVQTALRGLPWDNDYHFRFDFTVPEDLADGSYWLMLQSNGRVVATLDKDTRGSRFSLGTFSFTNGLTVYTPFQPSLAGRHEVTLAVVGTTLKITVDGTVYEQTGERVASSEYDSAITTQAPVTFHAIELVDDTSGTELWHATHADLHVKYPALPWPSPVPENFAKKAKAFYDCQAVVREALDPTHDYSFLIEAEIVRENPECSMFYAGGDKFPFGVYAYSDNTIRVFSNLLRPAGDTSSKYVTVVAYSGDTRLQGRHTIEFRIEGDAMRVFLDGNEIEHSYTFARTGTATVGLPNCNSGYVYKIQITDLTDNQVVWSYPSEAERVRLITKTNVRTDRGAFEAADTSKVSGITTTLDLRGTPVEHTLIVSGYFPLPSNNGLLHYFPLLTQGAALDGTGDRVTVGLLVRVDYRNQQTTRDIQVVWADSSYTLHSVSATVDSEFFDKCHLIAATLLVDRKTSKWTTELYVDGVQLASNTGSLTRFVFGSAGSTTLGVNSIQIQGRIYTGFLSESNKIEYALVIGRVLSAAEIKALTPGKQV